MDTLKKLMKISIWLWRYFSLVRAKKNLKKYEELWNKIRDSITSITKNSNDFDEKYMKIKFNLDDELPLNKTTTLTATMTIVVRAVFHGNNKYYPQVFLDE